MLLGAALAALASYGPRPASAATVDPVILDARFEEPLVASLPTSADEDAALARALVVYRAQADADDMRPLQGFLADHPQSGWRLALLTDIGLTAYHYGYFSRAIDAFEQAWAAGQAATDPHSRALADRAAGELLRMHARLGHAERVAALLGELDARGLSGPATELRDGAREGLWMMRNKPGVAYLCGPMALKNLLLANGASAASVGFLDDYRSGPHGVTLAEVGRLADQAKLPHQLVHRRVGQPVPVPSIVHWNVNHFAAIVARSGDRFQVEDPTFGRTMYVTRGAIDAEGSGYFLVPGQPAADAAWQPVGADEARRVFGMGYTNTNDPGDTTPQTPKTKPPPCPQGMCGYNFSEMLVSLNLVDNPVGYTPPKGPPVQVTLTYNQREASQPANFSFFNVSPKWSINWLTYIQDDPTLAGATVTRNVAGGGSVAYTGYSATGQNFAPEVQDGSQLSIVSTNPIRYQRTLADGSVETYAQSNNATSFPRLVFLTKLADPLGNAVSLTYDSLLRLTSVLDATGRSTKFLYGNASFPLQITQINDPFGHAATLAYDATGRLSSITDVIGLKSQFTYDSASLINALTTPYGTTNFTYGDNGNSRFLQATDPLGFTERLEYVQGAPGIPSSDPAATVPAGIVQPFNAYLNERDTFYWDKHAYAVAAGDYTKARNRHWTHLASNTNVTADTIESIKLPLENRVWYSYPGQANTGLGGGQSGTLNKPIAVGRVLDDGSTQLTQITYNAQANPTLIVDPVGRQTVFQYAANGIDVLTVQQNTASGLATVARFTYNAQHEPLTAVDAAGQTTTYTYNAAGQVTRVTDPLGHTTSYGYDGFGDLTSVVNALGKTAVSFTYDSAGRVATRTDSEGWSVSFAYDAFNRVTQETYPDGTTRTFTYNRLDLVSVKDRQGRVTTSSYDAVRNLVSVTDPLKQVTQYGHFENSALRSVTDPKGHTTNWAIDVEGRVNARQYADGSIEGYGYEATSSRTLFVYDALNQIKQYSYTPDDRLAGVHYYNSVNATPNVSYAYDPYFPRLASMTDGTGTTTYQYQAPGSLGALKLMQEKGPYLNTTLAYQYDALGRVIARGVGGNVDTLTYDALGRVVTHADDLGSFTRTYLGSTLQMTKQGNGVVGTSWSFDSNLHDRRLTAIANGTNASSFGLTTTPDSDITAISDALNAVNWTYGYDAANRLVSASPTSGTKYTYGYDASGNLSAILKGTTSISIPANSLNQITASNTTKFVYDANGKLLRDYARTYQWDADNRLIGIQYLSLPGTGTSFRYDGAGRRVAISAISNGTSAETRYLWCGSQVCQQRSSADTVLKRYFSEGEETLSGSLKLYYGVDELGSVTDAVSATTGIPAAHFRYEPYGRPTSAQGSGSTDFRYAGLFYHAQSGLYLANQRVYDPVVGHFLSRDPARDVGGPNLYSYGAGNPAIYTDPTGEFLNLAAGGIGAGIGGLLGGGGNLAYQLANNGGNWNCINWGDVGAWALGGAATGGLAGLTLGGSLIAEAEAGGEGLILSGHGAFIEGSGSVVLPEGTTFTQFTGLGNTITDALGNAIETGGDLAPFESEMAGAQSYLSGAEVPNYTLFPPEGLNIMGNPVTVSQPTLLSDIIQPGMGNVQWAACCEILPPP